MIVQILIYEDDTDETRVFHCTSIEDFNAAVKFTAQVLSKDEENLVA